jgi:hypothetical protein
VSRPLGPTLASTSARGARTPRSRSTTSSGGRRAGASSGRGVGVDGVPATDWPDGTARWQAIPVGAGLLLRCDRAGDGSTFQLSSGFGEPTAMASVPASGERVGGPRVGLMDQPPASAGDSWHLLDCRSPDSDWVPSRIAPRSSSWTREPSGARDVRVQRPATRVRRRRPERSASSPCATCRVDLRSRWTALADTVARRARHVITENARTIAAADALRAGDAEEVGHLMNETHRACGGLRGIRMRRLTPWPRRPRQPRMLRFDHGRRVRVRRRPRRTSSLAFERAVAGPTGNAPGSGARSSPAGRATGCRLRSSATPDPQSPPATPPAAHSRRRGRACCRSAGPQRSEMGPVDGSSASTRAIARRPPAPPRSSRPRRIGAPGEGPWLATARPACPAPRPALERLDDNLAGRPLVVAGDLCR